MPGPGTEKHYAGRYICQKPVDKCKGLFKQCGIWKPCPLADRCLSSSDGKGQLERFWPLGRYGKLLIQSTPNWNREHLKRRNEVLWAFDKENMLAYHEKYRNENRDTIRVRTAEWEAKQRLKKAVDDPEEGHGDKVTGFGMGARHIALPCGEDCRNCPEPGGPGKCPYTDEDEDALMAEEYPAWRNMDQKKKNAEYKKRKREEKRHGKQKGDLPADP